MRIIRTTTALYLAALILNCAVLFAGFAGRPLAEALTDLQSRGLDIFFTSNLVQPGMRVTAEPVATGLRELLDELLAPHGLAATDGPGGRLVVVAAGPRPSVIRGTVRIRGTGGLLPGARVLVAGASDVLSAADGSFLIPELTADTYEVRARLRGFGERSVKVSVDPGQTVDVVFEMEPMLVALDEIVVTPSRVSLLTNEPVAAVDLGRDEIMALPHYGDDIFRALTLLPGVTGEEASARFNVRGGREDEVLVLLDNLELYEPFHLKDFSSSLSIITPTALNQVNLITGGFPAQYGDRMSGVLEMSTQLPDHRRTHLGASILTAEVSSAGALGGDRGHWLASVRRGNLDLALDVLGHELKPEYWDAFGKMEYRPRPGHTLGLHVLHSDDNLDNVVPDPDSDAVETYLTSYGNSYAWLTHQAILGSRLFVDGVASYGRIDRNRFGTEEDPEEEPETVFTIDDSRTFDVAAFKQDWNLQATERHYLKWGYEVRSLEATYDYTNNRKSEDILEELRGGPRTRLTHFDEPQIGEQYSLYATDRWRLAKPLTLELGLRYDEQTLTDDRDLSPRLNLVYAMGPAGRGSTLRLAWGYFYQSQRPYELQIEDGETQLMGSERTEQRVIGFEHAFAVGRERRDLLFRIEAYQRKIKDPRMRFENLYEAFTEFPEIEPDRLEISPESGESYGVELYLRGSVGRSFDWWATYVYSRVTDLIDGRDVPRKVDQPHAFNFDLNYRIGRHWSLNLAWRYHTGWPTTTVSGVGEPEIEDDGSAFFEELEFGPLYGARLPAYHRLDLRASREWEKRNGDLGFFIEIQNVYDRQNVAGFDAEGRFALVNGEPVPVEEIWGGILPSFGITWEF